MQYMKLLDCTLRDGAYLVDKDFGKENIAGIIEGLVKAKIDFIEIGFFQNEGFGEGKTVYLNSEAALQYVPKEKKNSRFTVLADCSRYDVSNLDRCVGNSIDAVRECFFKSEVNKAIDNCRVIKAKGYMLFVQPVDILGYSDRELLDLIDMVNDVEPYCISIVDTFGSMYQEDLHRVLELMHHNLLPSIRIGFHSHNNMQLSNALSQEFLRWAKGKREVIIDGTLAGMGRGAGNTPTELIAQYMVSKMHAGYDIDTILDLLDTYMENIKSRCTWGYSTQYFVAGSLGAHVNNIKFLTEKNSIRSKDIRYILNKIGESARKRYDYNLLETVYMKYLESVIDDSESVEIIRKNIENYSILILLPGASLRKNYKLIQQFIKEKKIKVISVNVIPREFHIDYIFISNLKRYQYLTKDVAYIGLNKIVTSNVPFEADENTVPINFTKYIKCGWEHMDNSAIILLRLLDCMKLNHIYIAGFDGYDAHGKKNFYSQNLELANLSEKATTLNAEIADMLSDYMINRKNVHTPITCITESRFSTILEGNNND